MGGRYALINQYLLAGSLVAGKAASDVNLNDMEKSVVKIDRELDELGKPVRAGVTVFRKAGAAALYAGVNGAFTQAAYLSTSANPRYEWKNRPKEAVGQAFFTLQCMSIGMGRDVAHVRGNMNEAEVLFHRNVQFTFAMIDQDKKGNVHYLLEERPSPQAGFVWGAHKT